MDDEHSCKGKQLLHYLIIKCSVLSSDCCNREFSFIRY